MPDVTAPLRVGVLGYSDIARRRFIPALSGSGCAVLAAIGTSRSADTPDHGPDRTGDIPVPVTRQEQDTGRSPLPAGVPLCSYSDLIAHPDVDLVYLSLPNHLHEEWAVRALVAGKHVLCEKPLAPALESVERMIAAANRSGRLLFENLMFLQHPQHAAVRDLLTSGRIGPLRTVRSAFGFPLEDRANFRLDPARGGGACADLLTYTVGTLELFDLGDLRDPSGIVLHREGIDLAAHGTAGLANGAAFTFSISFCQQYESCYELVGAAGLLRLDRAYTTPPELANRLILRTGSTEEIIPLPAADHFAETIRHIARIIAHGTDFTAHHETTLRRHRTISAVKAALRPV